MGTPQNRASILVFNDDSEILQMLRDVLTDQGYEVTIQGLGTWDLDTVREHKPALVIVDCPPVNGEGRGWEFVQKMKLSPDTDAIPVILCSTSKRKLDELSGWLQGKNILPLLKPFNIKDLLSAVAHQLDQVTPAGGSD